MLIKPSVVKILKSRKCRFCKKIFFPEHQSQRFCITDHAYQHQLIKSKEWIQKNKDKVKTSVKKKKVKKETVASLKKKAWTIFSKYIRLRDCLNDSGTSDWGYCVSCKAPTNFVGGHAGHFLSGRMKPVLFNEGVCFLQCPRCNIFRHGNYEGYTKNLIQRYGIEHVMKLWEIKESTDWIWSTDELKEVIEKYKIKLLALEDK